MQSHPSLTLGHPHRATGSSASAGPAGLLWGPAPGPRPPGSPAHPSCSPPHPPPVPRGCALWGPLFPHLWPSFPGPGAGRRALRFLLRLPRNTCLPGLPEPRFLLDLGRPCPPVLSGTVVRVSLMMEEWDIRSKDRAPPAPRSSPGLARQISLVFRAAQLPAGCVLSGGDAGPRDCGRERAGGSGARACPHSASPGCLPLPSEHSPEEADSERGGTFRRLDSEFETLVGGDLQGHLAPASVRRDHLCHLVGQFCPEALSPHLPADGTACRVMTCA